MAFSSQDECKTLLKEAQEADHDNREMSREADLFLNKRNGQWEQSVLDKWERRPRYTFDECNPIIDGIMGEIEAMDWGISVRPTGTQSSKKIAEIYSGIIRTIQNISKPTANFVYNQSARIMVSTGFDAWRVVTRYRDDDSIQQDLMIDHVANAQDCIWFDPNAVKPDMSDSDFAWNLFSLTKRAYKKKYPGAGTSSVSSGRTDSAFFHKKPDEIVIGEALYKKTKTRELVQMTNGGVYVVNNDFLSIKDELQQAGIEVHKTRKRKYNVVYQRMFNDDDWITDEKETVFCYIPIVPVFGNFRISDNKVIYWGIVEKLMDPQRVINYSESRKIEEGALAPKGKVWMSKDQAKSSSVRNTLRTLNTNNDPVQFYDFVEGQVPPTYVGSPPSNPNLVETTQAAQNFVQRTSGTYDEDRGTAPPRRSGIAIEKLQTKSDAPKRKWITSMEIAISHTFDILMKAIPKVYDTPQIMVLTAQDGSTDTTSIFQKVKDNQSGRVITINDLNQGTYSAVCKAGPSFKTKQAETVAAITDYAQIDPTILELGGDILLNNINSPGIEKIAARKRMMMLAQGIIPPDQMTKEEQAMMEKQKQNKDSDMTPIDRANLMIAQAEMTKADSQAEEAKFKAQVEATKLKLKEIELGMKQQDGRSKQMLEAMKQLNDQIKVQAETLKLIREASGADVIVTPELSNAFAYQTRELTDSIRNQ